MKFYPNRHLSFVSLFLLIFFPTCQKASKPLPPLPEITHENRPWTYWWWLGSAVTPEGIREQLTGFHEKGIGGVHIIPIYGVKGEEENFLPYLGGEWVEMLDLTIQEAAKLDMGVDMSMGTGWPFGGPNIPDSLVAQAYTIQKKGELSQKGFLWDEKNGEAFFQQPTGQRVKRAAPGGEGFVFDYFHRAALQHYSQRFDSLLSNPQLEQKPRAFYHDSYEVYGANWSVAFPEAFRKKRGYDFMEHWQALADTVSSPQRDRTLSDYHATIAELLYENFTEPWATWCTERGLLTRNQAHGSPGNLLDLYGLVDIPETESFGASAFNIPGLRQDPDYEESRFGRPEPLTMKFASSPAHLMGKKRVSSETTTWLGNHFKVSPSQVKPQLDELFAAGINHVFFHGIPYSPPNEPFPGWLFYASTHFGPHSHLWNDLEDITGYIARCQALLQESVPNNDILLYFPIQDLWDAPGRRSGNLHMLDVHFSQKWLAETPFGSAARQLTASGFTFDYVSDKQLKKLVSPTSGQAIHPEGKNPYRAIVIPPTQYMPLKTLRTLADLADKGIPILFQNHFPRSVPGFYEWEEREAKMQALLEEQGESPSFRVVGDLAEALAESGIPAEELGEIGLRFLRKKTPYGHLYFAANLDGKFEAGEVTLSVAAESIEMYDPITLERGIVEHQNLSSQSRFFLRLPPGKSCFIRTYHEKRSGPIWHNHQPTEEKWAIEGDWKLNFLQGAPSMPKDTLLQELMYWSALEGEEYQAFSGEVSYKTTFRVPKDWVGVPCRIDLSSVRETADVVLNGEQLGKAWAIPFVIDIPEGMLQEENTIQITVNSLSANHIRWLDAKTDDWKKFYDINFVDIRYRPFDASHWEVMDAGLNGPLHLIKLEPSKSALQ